MQLARRRLKLARYSISAVTLTAFAAFGFAVRDAHPATHTKTTTSTSSAAASTGAANSGTPFGGSAVLSPAPQAVVPQAHSTGS